MFHCGKGCVGNTYAEQNGPEMAIMFIIILDQICTCIYIYIIYVTCNDNIIIPKKLYTAM